MGKFVFVMAAVILFSGTSLAESDESFAGFDGTNLFYGSWESKNPQAVMVVVHGFGEHSGRYEEMASMLTENGFNVYTMDLRGHGRSDGERWNPDSFDDYIKDLKIFMDLVKEKEENRDVFLLGHSLGGEIVLKYAILYPENIKGVIASSPSVGTYLSLPVIGRSAVALGMLRLTTPVMGLLARIAPSLHVTGTQIDPQYLNHDRENYEAYANDPLVCHEPMKLRFSYEASKNILFLQEHADELKIPCLIMYGTSDVIVPPDSIREFYGKVNSEDKKLYSFDGYYHEIFNEVGKEAVYKVLFSWLTSMVPKGMSEQAETE